MHSIQIYGLVAQKKIHAFLPVSIILFSVKNLIHKILIYVKDTVPFLKLYFDVLSVYLDDFVLSSAKGILRLPRIVFSVYIVMPLINISHFFFLPFPYNLYLYFPRGFYTL